MLKRVTIVAALASNLWLGLGVSIAQDYSRFGVLDAQLGKLYEDARYDEAIALAEKYLAESDTENGSVATSWLGLLYAERGQDSLARPLLNRTILMIRRWWEERRTNPSGFAAAFASREPEKEIDYAIFLKTAYWLGRTDATQMPELMREAFAIAQLREFSKAAASLSQMAARQAKGDTELARLVREQQDLEQQWLNAQRLLFSSDTGLASIPILLAERKLWDQKEAKSAALLKKFPEYTDLVKPSPLALADVQNHLHSHEALVLLLDVPNIKFRLSTPPETLLWVVTKSDARWVRVTLRMPALAVEVSALRCGLDDSLWDDKATAERCRQLLGAEPSRDDQNNVRKQTLPFDYTRAHALYKAIFGEVEDLIQGKSLLIVPSGPLTQLPFQVLLTEQRKDSSDKAAWLARRHAITVLPSVSSLRALRRLLPSSAATKPILGIGNPLLDGPDASYGQAREDAAKMQWCEELPKVRVARGRGLRGLKPIARGSTTAADVRQQVPLPETADELCTVAKVMGATRDDVLLGAKATERHIKSLSDAGTLRNYRLLHFATHGTLVGEIADVAEPGLLLTPPLTPDETDDGYLSASEIASLKLDADWVILSACNTAAGEAQDAEALSGLARAFFYAGARALLVSHWYVHSEATVALIRSAFAELQTSPKIGRAEALRRAMLGMIDQGPAWQAHPAFWAPFVVVGEGAATN